MSPKTFDQYRADIDADSHVGTQSPLDDDLESLTVPQLRELADERRIDHAGLKKAELVEALTQEA